jgi:hypothetical protein
VASLRGVRNDFLVNSYALGMEHRFKDGEDSIIIGCLYNIAEYVLLVTAKARKNLAGNWLFFRSFVWELSYLTHSIQFPSFCQLLLSLLIDPALVATL